MDFIVDGREEHSILITSKRNENIWVTEKTRYEGQHKIQIRQHKVQQQE